MRSPRVRVRCNECGRRWSVSATTGTAPQCSKCNSVDVEPVDDECAKIVEGSRERLFACTKRAHHEGDCNQGRAL